MKWDGEYCTWGREEVKGVREICVYVREGKEIRWVRDTVWRRNRGDGVNREEKIQGVCEEEERAEGVRETRVVGWRGGGG